MTHILVVHGPNLGILGRRQPEIYGTTSLTDVNAAVTHLAESWGWTVATYQSNVEGFLIDFLEANAPSAHGMLLNPGALTHYGLALRDALAALSIPVVETHLSNIHARSEEWRRHSVTAEVSKGIVSGFGWQSYLVALHALRSMLEPAS